MTWLTWRQHRWEAAFALVVLLVLGGGVVTLTFASSGLVTEVARECQTNIQGIIPNACGTPRTQFSVNFLPVWWWVVVVGTVIPALVGMFIGAPMIAREVENATYLLIWSQGITRRRWFLSRVGLVILGAVLTAALVATAAEGWFTMQRTVGSPMSVTLWDGFEIGAPVVIAYTLFALALGVAASAAIRRTVPAMAATLIGFVASRIAIALLARPNFLPPFTSRAKLIGSQSGFTIGAGPSPSSWLVGPATLSDPAGHSIPGGFCVGSGSCYSNVIAIQHYQPGDRFWTFQGIEAAIFVVLALALFVLAYRLVMRIR